MIVGSQKPFPELWEMVKGFKKVMVIGCNTCVAICHAGGGKEAVRVAGNVRVLSIANAGAVSRIWMAHRRRGGGALLQTLVELAMAERLA